jgi:glycosyltransferase involved in cell wall biosynthesis
MKFVVLTEYFYPEVGATQARLEAVCRELTRAGHLVEVVTAMPHHPAGKIAASYRGRFYVKEMRDGVTIHRVWLYAANGSGLNRILNYLSFMVTSLAGLLRAKRPDYVFVDSPPLTLAVSAWIAARCWNRPLIFNVADLWPDSARDLGVIRNRALLRIAGILERWIYRRADRITAVTEGIRTALLYQKNVPAAKLLFLPNGADTDLFQPVPPDESLRRQLGLTRKRIVLYAGNHGYAGAVDQVLDAADALTDDERIHFLLVGDGPQKAQLQERSRRMGLTNITFIDSVPLDELPRIIAFSDCAVVTLRRAAVTRGARPAKALVMMAAAKPVVLTGEGEAADLISQAGAGFVVPPENPPALARAIRTMLSDPAAARAMGLNGRSFIQSHLEWSMLVRNWLNELTQTGSPAVVVGREKQSEKTQDRISDVRAAV